MISLTFCLSCVFSGPRANARKRKAKMPVTGNTSRTAQRILNPRTRTIFTAQITEPRMFRPGSMKPSTHQLDMPAARKSG